MSFTAIGFDLYGVVEQGGGKDQQAVVELIRRLRANGYMVGLLSNVDANFEFLHAHHWQLGEFDRVLLSSDIGVAKPNKQAYERLVYQLGSIPTETIFIDDLADNVDGAEAADVTGILFTGCDDLIKRLTAKGVNCG